MKPIKIIGIIGASLAVITTAVVLVVRSKKPDVQIDENGNIIETGSTDPNAPGNQTTPGGQITPGAESKLDEVINEKLKSILTIYKTTGKFANAADAEYFIKNTDYLDENERISTAEIKNALKRSNLVYFDGKVTTRMTADEVEKFFMDMSPKAGGKAYMEFNKVVSTPGNNGYGSGSGLNNSQIPIENMNSPILTPYTNYQLKKLLANGWWFALWYDGGGNYAGHRNGYSTTNPGNFYALNVWDMWGSNPTNRKMVKIPDTLKTDEYSYYSFSAKGKNNLI